MKDIYELLNDVTIDENEFEEMTVNDLEKAKVKKFLKSSIHEKKKKKNFKKNIVAAVIIVGLSATTFGLTFPAYAKNILVIDDIFRFFDQGGTVLTDSSKQNMGKKKNETGLFYDYKKYSNQVNITKESSGIKFTINDAVFDGKTATLTYTIESNQDLGNAGLPLPKIKGMNAVGGTGKTTKIDKNKYLGILTVSNMEDKKLKIANIDWNIDHIQNPENQVIIKGDWKFSFNVNAIDSKMQLTDSSSEKNGVKINLEKISVSPMSFTVEYNQEVSKKIRNIWDGVYIDLEIKDDLGNVYSGQDNGGMGDDQGYNRSWSKTFKKLDPDATKLIITPHVMLSDYNSDNYSSVQITKDGVKEIPLPEKPGKGKKEFVLEDIIINLKK